MRPGFEVTLTATGEAKFQLYFPENTESSSKYLVSFAQNFITKMAAVVMGKIYYQDKLKSNFLQKSKREINSDADLVLVVFRDYGLAALEKLEGEFALVIFDPENSCLVALRDHLGSWPIYWTYHNQEVYISNNLQLLARRKKAAINRDFLASFLMFSYAFVELATETTAFTDIRRILPGKLLSLHPQGRVTQHWHWNWLNQIQPRQNINIEEAASQFIHIFRQAIAERIREGNIASHLSGGMDSSAVVCIGRDLVKNKRLITLSLVYKMRSLVGETDYIQMVIDQRGGIEPHFVDGDKALDFQWFKETIPEHDEPYPGLFHLAMEKVLVDLASQLDVTTILTGGGAELIVEGNRYHLADLLRRGRWQKALQIARQWAQAKNVSTWSILSQLAVEPLIPPHLREGFGTLLRRGYGSWPKLGSFAIPPWILPQFAQDYQLWAKAIATMDQISQYPVEQSFNLLGLRTAAGNCPGTGQGA